MKLTREEVENIYALASVWFSQRRIAKTLGHTRVTVSRHLQTKELCQRFTGKRAYLSLANRGKSMWKTIAIAALICYSWTILALFSYFFL